MAKIKTQDVLVGTSGNVWLNGELLANITKIEIKLTGNFEDNYFVGDFGQKNIYTGWSGDGTISLKKINSKFITLLGDAYKTGDMPELKVVASLTNRSTSKTERVAISDVVITECNLANWEANGSITEDLPIKFSDYEILETI